MFIAIRNQHPLVFLLLMFLGMPIILLTAVTLFTAAAILPMSLIFGWL